ncbi:zinc ribbon domain-containing protein [Pyxidicoccus sp. 3LG]
MTEDPVEQAEAWLPFTVDPEAARGALMGFLGKGGFFRPSGLARDAALESLRPMWWPAWSFRAGVDVSWTADSDAGSGRSDWGAARGTHALRVRRHPRAGLARAEAEGVRGARAPLPARNGGGGAARAGGGARRALRGDALRGAPHRAGGGGAAVERALQQGVIPGRRFRNVRVAVALSSLHTRRLALPVYVLAYRYEDKPYRVLVHGQEVRVVFGEAPISGWRVAAVVAGVLILVLAVLLAMGVLGS